MSRIVVGADEAARGLIIGPMVIGACAINETIEDDFYQIGIKDSKRYTSQLKLKQHANYIKNQSLAWSTQTISAEVLTNFSKNRMTMDEAEAYAFFKAIKEIKKKVKTIDVFQVDNFQAVSKLRSLLKNDKQLQNVKLIVIPKAEEEYIAVSGGSILAREKSLVELDTIRKKYGDFGSGSTSDKRTINWLRTYYKKNKSWPKIVRTYWKTIDKIEKEMK